MDFRKLKKFLISLKDKYDIPGYDCCVYYDHRYVFRHRSGATGPEADKKVSTKDLYFTQSGAKLVIAVAIMQLAERYKLCINDKVSLYVPEIGSDVTVREMIRGFSANIHDEAGVFDFENVKKLIESAAGMPFSDFIKVNITSPLKMENTGFDTDVKTAGILSKQYAGGNRGENLEKVLEENLGYLITSVDDFILLCETLCARGTSRKNYRLLSEYSVDLLVNELIYNETEKSDAYVTVGYNGTLIIFDIKRKISIVYAQHLKKLDTKQLEMYPELRKIAYECTGADTWSRGYNLFG